MFASQLYQTRTEKKSGSAPADHELFRTLLQPHFLFNSLNNLYALSVKKSEQTPAAIAGLSELLQKVVYSAQQELIPLSMELKLIREYINLEKIWLGENAFYMDLSVSGSTDGVMIPPLSLYTLVENGFKHGVRRSGNNGWITIQVVIKEDKLWFITRNSLPESDGDDVAKSVGIGLQAVKSVLGKSFPASHQLEARRIGNLYCVDLKIDELFKKSA
ncbi:MAG: sensor histidine kinase [Bacteroidota bacterium]